MITQKINLNLIPNGVMPRVNVSQYDYGSRTLEITLYNGASLFTIPTGAQVVMQGTKKDNRGFQYVDLDYSGSVVTADITQQMTVFEDEVQVELVIITGSDDNKQQLATANFILNVEQAALKDDIVVSETDIPAIQTLPEAMAEVNYAVELLETALPTVEGSIEEAEAWARGTKNSVPVTSEDEQYHNNSKYYSEQASSSAGTAGTNALNAEAFGAGTRNGTDVTSDDAAYQNNAKYYAGQAGNNASAASGSATAASGSALDAEAYGIGKRGGVDVESGDVAYQNNSKYYAGLASNSANNAGTNAETAEAYAKGTRSGSAISSDDPAYNNNSKYYSEQASGYANTASDYVTSASAQSDQAQAWAIGERDGQPVPSTDPTYHNNAKYWAEQASQAAGGGVTSFNGRTGSVSPTSGDYDITQISPTSGATEGQVVVVDFNGDFKVDDAPSSGHTIVDENDTAYTKRSNLKFKGATITDDPTNDATIVSVDNPSIRASYEESPTLYPHSVNDTIYYNGKLYKVITAISVGDTLVVDTNIEETDFDTDTAVYVVNMPGKAEGEIVVSKNSVSLNSKKRSDKIAVGINSDGIVTVSTSDSNVATAAYSNGVLTITSRYGGNCTVTISVSETPKYTAAVKTISVTSTQTYTIRLNMEDSNPNTWGEYIDCIVTPVSAGGGENEIDALMGYYPVVLKNGVEGKLIDPSDNSKYIDGTSISESDGDSMVAFPSRGYRLNWYDSTHLDVSITNEENRDGYKYPTYKGDEIETFYHSMYEGFVEDGKLHSWSGKAPTVNQAIGTFRTQAQANGTGYEQRTYNELTYLQCCALIKFKGRNAQTALGRGFVDGNSAAATTGGTNAYGLNYGETTGKVQMKLFGIEDFWGNIFDFVDGIFSNANRQIQVADGNFNNTGSGYTTVGASFSSNISGYLKDVIGTDEGGFAPASQSYGSATTYFCDHASVSDSRLAAFGGDWANTAYAGLFLLYVSRAASSASTAYGSRLTYFKVKES